MNECKSIKDCLFSGWSWNCGSFAEIRAENDSHFRERKEGRKEDGHSMEKLVVVMAKVSSSADPLNSSFPPLLSEEDERKRERERADDHSR